MPYICTGTYNMPPVPDEGRGAALPWCPPITPFVPALISRGRPSSYQQKGKSCRCNLYQLARQKISAKECTYKYNFMDLPWGFCHCSTIAPAHTPARSCHTANVLGEVTFGRGENENFCSGLAVHGAHSHRRGSPGSPANHLADIVHPSPGHPSATVLLQEPARTFSSFDGFVLGSKAIELAREKQDIQEPGKDTACTHCSVWVPSGRIGPNCCPASSKSCTDVPFLQETGRDSHPW